MTDTYMNVPDEPPYREILTERLRLRTARLSDTEALMPMISNQDVMQWTSHAAVSTVEQGRRWLSARVLGPEVFQFAIQLRSPNAEGPDHGPVIGIAGSFIVGQVGYMIDPKYAGHGYATEAIQAVIPELFHRYPVADETESGLNYVEAWTDVSNFASRRILEKCDFVLCERVAEPDHPIRGDTETLIYRKARPGMNLHDLGLVAIAGAEDPPPQPPIE